MSRIASPKTSPYRFAFLVAAVLALSTLMGGVFGPRILAVSDAASPSWKEYSDLLATARSWYADDLSTEKLVYASIQGMLSTLDPHTNFLEPEEYGAMQEKQRGSFFGLGIIISKRNGKVTVISPIEGSPAERLGIRAGDIIEEVEGQPIDDLPVDAVVKKLKGPKGTKVRITVVRPGLGEPLQMTVTRAEIPTNSVAFAFMLPDDVGYIRLKDFTRTSAPELSEAWDRLDKQGMKKLVFDLRGNPGGLLDQAVAVSDFFLNKGEKIVITRGRTSSSEQVFAAPGRETKSRIPTVLLINKGSASASEIVAGALQDHDRALIVGQTSWGKGLVQSVFTLTDGAGLALTSAKYYTPSGRCIQRDYKELLEYVTPLDEEDGGEGAAEAEPEPSKKEIYRTDSGREVFGGGGITPDVVVAGERLSRFCAGLFARGQFFEFAVQYRAHNPSIPKDFRVTNEIRADFLRYVDSQPGAPDGGARAAFDAEKDAGKATIDRSLAEEVLTAVYGREAGYRLTLQGDAQLQKALGLFPQAAKLAGIPAESRPEGAPRLARK